MKTTAELNKAIDGIKTAGAKLDALIQTTGVNVLEHFAEHKDTGVVNRLYLALPNGARKTALASWLLAYGALVPNTDKKIKDEQPFSYSRDKTTNVEAAKADMWFNHKPEKAVDEVFDLQKAVMGILARARTAPKLVHGDVNTLKDLARSVGIDESKVTVMTPVTPTA